MRRDPMFIYCPICISKSDTIPLLLPKLVIYSRGSLVSSFEWKRVNAELCGNRTPSEAIGGKILYVMYIWIAVQSIDPIPRFSHNIAWL